MDESQKRDERRGGRARGAPASHTQTPAACAEDEPAVERDRTAHCRRQGEHLASGEQQQLAIEHARHEDADAIGSSVGRAVRLERHAPMLGVGRGALVTGRSRAC